MATFSGSDTPHCRQAVVCLLSKKVSRAIEILAGTTGCEPAASCATGRLLTTQLNCARERELPHRKTSHHARQVVHIGIRTRWSPSFHLHRLGVFLFSSSDQFHHASSWLSLLRQLATSTDSAEQPSESVLCLKLRYWIEFPEFFSAYKTSNSEKELRNNEGCVGDSRPCRRAVPKSES